MLINKMANVQYAAVGDRVTFTLQVINNDAFSINNVLVSDVLPPQLQFVAGSLIVGGQSSQGNIATGIVIGTLLAGAMISVKFDVDVLSEGDGTLSNVATGSYSYQAPGMAIPEFRTVSSPVFILRVIDPTITVEKVASQTAVNLGDIVYFTITAEQVGSVEINNVIIQDILNPAFKLIPDTLTINNQPVTNPDLTQGLIVPSIPAGGAVIVSFATKVVGGSSIGCVINTAKVTGTYIYPDGRFATKTWTSNTVRMYVNVTNFKQLTFGSSFTVPMQKPDIEDINTVTASVEVTDSYVVPTMSGVSNEGQILTGNKLVVNGTIKVIVTYTGLVPTQDSYAIYCEIPFGTFIVLPVDYQTGYRVEVIGTVEKATAVQESARRFYVNIALLLKAAIII